MKQGRALRPDAQAFDEVRITTIPRFKQSGLSGDEWRISARVQLMRKGEVIVEDSFGTVESAIHALGWVHMRAIDDGKAYFAGQGDTCDQEGCSEKGTVEYRMLKKYCNEPYSHEAKEYGEDTPTRLFCERHSKRGDSCFNDRDENYVALKDKGGEK